MLCERCKRNLWMVSDYRQQRNGVFKKVRVCYSCALLPDEDFFDKPKQKRKLKKEVKNG